MPYLPGYGQINPARYEDEDEPDDSDYAHDRKMAERDEQRHEQKNASPLTLPDKIYEQLPAAWPLLAPLPESDDLDGAVIRHWTDTLGALKRYFLERLDPGDQLCAVLSNDLMGAICLADYHSLRELPGLVQWLAAHAPRACWGSRKRVKQWLKSEAIP